MARPLPLASALRAVSFEADQAAQVLTDPDVVVATRLPSLLRGLPAVLGPERVAGLADRARVRFHAAA